MSTIITKRQFPNYRKYEMELAGRPLFLEVGKLAELANAAVMVGRSAGSIDNTGRIVPGLPFLIGTI